VLATGILDNVVHLADAGPWAKFRAQSQHGQGTKMAEWWRVRQLPVADKEKNGLVAVRTAPQRGPLGRGRCWERNCAVPCRPVLAHMAFFVMTTLKHSLQNVG